MIEMMRDSTSFASCSAGCTEGCLPYVEASCACSNITQCCGSFTPAYGCTSQSSGTCSPLQLPPGVTYSNGAISASFATGSPVIDLSHPQGIEAMQRWVMENGPVAVSFSGVDSYDFRNYWSTLSSSGPQVVQCYECDGSDSDWHVVSLVGWTMLAGSPAWIIQNSWGSLGGDAGFFYVNFSNVGTQYGQFYLFVAAGVQVNVSSIAGAHRTSRSLFEHAVAKHAFSPTTVLTARLHNYIKNLPGSRVALDHSVAHARGLVDALLSALDTQYHSSHALVRLESVQRQVVNGVLFHFNALVEAAGVTYAVQAVLADSFKRSGEPQYVLLHCARTPVC